MPPRGVSPSAVCQGARGTGNEGGDVSTDVGVYTTLWGSYAGSPDDEIAVPAIAFEVAEPKLNPSVEPAV